MTDIPTLTKKLEGFGINQLEAKVYLYLLGREPKTILEIARKLNLPRTTVYDTARQLVEHGLVEKIIEYKRQKVRAFTPEILEGVMARERERVEMLAENLAFLKQNLAKALDISIHTDARYYHGASGFRQMMWNALAAQKEHVGYSELGRVEIVGKKFLKQWMEEMIKRKIRDRVIINPKKETLNYLTRKGEGEFRKRYQNTRVIDEGNLLISGDTTIYNNVFAVAYWKQGEVVGVEIENQELVKTQKSIFEILWKQAKTVSEKI